jgi:hypothetical protein
MTTSIITNLISPMCELFYKYQTTIGIQSATINTIRNFGFSTNYSLNFGFELYQPFDFNNIKLQPGVFTYQSNYYVLPTLSTSQTISVQNLIYLQDLPASLSSTVNYQNKTLPISITIQQSGSSIIGIASNYYTNGIPYNSNSAIDSNVIRNFESGITTTVGLSILILANLENVTFAGISSSWTVQPTSLYTYEIISYRYNNGFGQFYSYLANNSFISNNLIVNFNEYNRLFNSTYAIVYDWVNYLTWIPNFTTWYASNKSTLPTFVHRFLVDYFSLS